MKQPLAFFLLLLILFCSASLNGYTQAPPGIADRTADSTNSRALTSSADKSDDEFNLFLFAYLIAFISVVVGGVIVGSTVVMGLLLLIFALISAGILSAGILVGLYRKSVTAGFKAVLLICCSLVGMLVCGPGLWLANKIFHFHLTSPIAVLIGAGGGLVSGLLLGAVLFILIRIFMEYCRRKLLF